VALTPAQYDFVYCLVSGDTIPDASTLVGVHRSTGWRWWQLEEVQEEYRRQCEAARDLVIGRLQAIAMQATQELLALTKHHDPKIRRAAASDLLRYFFMGNAQSDFNEARKLLQQLRREREHAGDLEGSAGAEACGTVTASTPVRRCPP